MSERAAAVDEPLGCFQELRVFGTASKPGEVKDFFRRCGAFSECDVQWTEVLLREGRESLRLLRTARGGEVVRVSAPNNSILSEDSPLSRQGALVVRESVAQVRVRAGNALEVFGCVLGVTDGATRRFVGTRFCHGTTGLRVTIFHAEGAALGDELVEVSVCTDQPNRARAQHDLAQFLLRVAPPGILFAPAPKSQAAAVPRGVV